MRMLTIENSRSRAYPLTHTIKYSSSRSRFLVRAIQLFLAAMRSAGSTGRKYRP